MLAHIKKNISPDSVIEWLRTYFFSHVLISLWVMTLYFLSFSKLLPDGINKAYVTRSGTGSLWFTSLLTIMFFSIMGIKKNKWLFSSKAEYKFSPEYVFLLLLPLIPVTQYILNNLDILSFFDATYLFLIFLIFVAFFVILVPFLLQKIGSGQMIMVLGVAFTFSILNMGILSQYFSWHEVGTLKKQLPVFLAPLFLCWIFFYGKNQKTLYALIVFVFLSNGITQVLGKISELSEIDSQNTSSGLLSLIDTQSPVITPDIYLLVYDAYVVNETLLSYGIDNQAQERYLEEQGFKIYPHTYSIGNHTVGTMSRVLNASTNYYGDIRKGVSGDGVVQNSLKGFGYKTYGIFPSDFFFRGMISSYDYSFPSYVSAPKDLMVKAIFTGEFQFDIGFDDVPREQFLVVKNDLFSAETEHPKFIYSHASNPGHSQNSGTCLSNEIELFHERLLDANFEMVQDVNTIVEHDPDAIIIIAGDHGPYLTKTCYRLSNFYDLSEISRLDIQDRYGTFLAIRWPSGDFEEYDDIVVLQDVFPAIFAYIFEDPKLLDAKVPSALIGDILSGASVVDGIIKGGINDGETLFIDVGE